MWYATRNKDGKPSQVRPHPSRITRFQRDTLKSRVVPRVPACGWGTRWACAHAHTRPASPVTPSRAYGVSVCVFSDTNQHDAMYTSTFNLC